MKCHLLCGCVIIIICHSAHDEGGDLGWVKGCCYVIYCVAVLLLSFVTAGDEGGDLGWVKGCCNVIYCVAVLLLSFVTLQVTRVVILVGVRVVVMSSIVWMCNYYHLSLCA